MQQDVCGPHEDESSFLKLIGVYAQYIRPLQLMKEKEGHEKICIQARKRMETVPTNLRLEYVCTHRTKRFHYKSQIAQSFHSHFTHNTSDPSNEPS